MKKMLYYEHFLIAFFCYQVTISAIKLKYEILITILDIKIMMKFTC